MSPYVVEYDEERDLIKSISGAFGYLKQQGEEIPLDIQFKARQFGVIKAAGDLPSVNATYHDAISEILAGYFEDGGSVTGPRNAMKRAAATGFLDAFELGWTENGGELPMEEDALAWLDARLNQEFGYIDGLFEQAKQLRKEEDADTFGWSNERADSYTATLQAIYNAGAMWAKASRVGIWELGNTEKHCATCSKLNGKAHKLSWYLARNYIPRQPGAAMDCGGYHCDCRIKDKKTGEEITL
jgi:hypothetical protein